jgi:hypothetical protein
MSWCCLVQLKLLPPDLILSLMQMFSYAVHRQSYLKKVRFTNSMSRCSHGYSHESEDVVLRKEGETKGEIKVNELR